MGSGGRDRLSQAEAFSIPARDSGVPSCADPSHPPPPPPRHVVAVPSIVSSLHVLEARFHAFCPSTNFLGVNESSFKDVATDSVGLCYSYSERGPRSSGIWGLMRNMGSWAPPWTQSASASVKAPVIYVGTVGAAWHELSGSHLYPPGQQHKISGTG